MTYTAFISYSRTDKVIGTKFHDFIEKYKIPKPLRDRSNGKRLGKIFRDQSDLAASPSLRAELEQSLLDSEYLIVLCSPEAAKSNWVNDEIYTFKSIGRASKIITVLVDGQPTKFDPQTASNGAFPPALFDNGREIETQLPFAPDLRESSDQSKNGDGFELGCLKVISQILDVSVSELTQRHIEAIKAERRRAIILAASGVTLSVAAIIGASLAVVQTKQANKRLGQAIDSATSFVSASSQIRDDFGVPSSVPERLLQHAEERLSPIMVDVGDNPRLMLESSKYHLRLAELYDVVGRTPEKLDSIQDARSSLATLEDGSMFNWQQTLFGQSVSIEDTVLTKLSLYDLETAQHVNEELRDPAIETSTAAVDEARHWFEVTGTGLWSGQLAHSLCNLASVHYNFGEMKPAKTRYLECFETAQNTNAHDRTAEIDALQINALTQVGMLHRALEQREQAFETHDQTLKLASEIAVNYPESTEIRRLKMRAHANYADSILGSGRSLDDALAAYNDALAEAENLTQSDPTRTDWKRDKGLLLERIASTELQSLDAMPIEDREVSFANIDRHIGEAIEIFRQLNALEAGGSQRLTDLSVGLEVRANRHLIYSNLIEDVTYLEEATTDILQVIDLRMAVLDQASRAENPIPETYALANAHSNAGRILAQKDTNLGVAFIHFEQAHNILQSLIATSDEQPGWRLEVAHIHYQKADALASRGKNDDAVVELKKSAEIIATLISQYPENHLYPKAKKEVSEKLMRIFEIE